MLNEQQCGLCGDYHLTLLSFYSLLHNFVSNTTLLLMDRSRLSAIAGKSTRVPCFCRQAHTVDLFLEKEEDRGFVLGERGKEEIKVAANRFPARVTHTRANAHIHSAS